MSTQTKADETFQEGVQALANWIQFLEGKQRTYKQQLERARAAGNGQAAEESPFDSAAAAVIPADPPAVMVIGRDDGSDDAWQIVGIGNAGDAEMEAWDLESEDLPDDGTDEDWQTLADEAESEAPPETAMGSKKTDGGDDDQPVTPSQDIALSEIALPDTASLEMAMGAEKDDGTNDDAGWL